MRSDIIHNLTDSAAEFLRIIGHKYDDTNIIKYEVLWKDRTRSHEYAHRFTDPSVLSRYHGRKGISKYIKRRKTE